jgi:anaerobic selenocysteine-containing dehydrogenase
LKKNQERLSEDEEKKQSGEVTRRDFLVGAGTVVVGGAIGAGLLSSCKGEETVTTTLEKTKTVTTTLVGDDAITVTKTTTVQGGPGDSTVTVTSTVPGDGGAVLPAYEEETSFLKACCIGGKGGCPAVVDVKNNKIVRIRPLHYNEKYTEEELSNTKWEYTYNGVTFKSRDRSEITYFDVGYKKRIDSPNRVPIR